MTDDRTTRVIDPTRQGGPPDPEALSHKQLATQARIHIDERFKAFGVGECGIAQLIGHLWLVADTLSERVFEMSGRPEWTDRIRVLLEANNREVEWRRAAEAEIVRLNMLQKRVGARVASETMPRAIRLPKDLKSRQARGECR